MHGMLRGVTAPPPSKKALREKIAASRAARPRAGQDDLARDLRDRLLDLPALADATRVAAFLSHDGEPGTQPLIDALRSRGVEILIPILREDFDLNWATYEPGQQEHGRFGLLVPTTAPLGVEAISSVDVVICPGVAADRAGHRLGRGGGSYDRALGRCGRTVIRVQLAYDDEVLDAVPVDPHDEPVDLVVTPTETIRVSRPAEG